MSALVAPSDSGRSLNCMNSIALVKENYAHLQISVVPEMKPAVGSRIENLFLQSSFLFLPPSPLPLPHPPPLPISAPLLSPPPSHLPPSIISLISLSLPLLSLFLLFSSCLSSLSPFFLKTRVLEACVDAVSEGANRMLRGPLARSDSVQHTPKPLFNLGPRPHKPSYRFLPRVAKTQ